MFTKKKKFHINQAGYELSGPKTAVLESDVPAEEYVIIDAETGAEVFRAVTGKEERVDEWFRDRSFHRLDFSSFASEGNYYLKIPKTDIVSMTFRISDDLLFSETFHLLLDYFRKSRADCTDADGKTDSRLWDREGAVPFFDAPELGTRDVRGGWYDASGDLSKYFSHLNFTNYLVPQQTPLSCYIMADCAESIDVKLKDTGLIGRIRDEALWGADFLVRMLDDEGFFYKCIFDRWTANIKKRTICMFRDFGVQNKMWQAGFREGAGTAIAALARIGRWKENGAFTYREYSDAAVRAWNHLAADGFARAREYVPDGTLNFIDYYSILMAASELYLSTGGAEYRKAAEDMVDNIGKALHADGYFIADGKDRPFYHAADAGLPLTALAGFVTAVPDSTLKERALDIIGLSLEYMISITGETANPFGYARQHILTGGRLENDRIIGGSVRSGFFISHDNESGYWWQGENARLASLAAAAVKGIGVLKANGRQADFSEYLNYAYDQLSWILGMNPFGMCFLEGAGSVNSPAYPRKSTFHSHIPGGIANGITGKNTDGTGIEWCPGRELNPYMRWRWTEQWLPHAHWFMSAVAALSV